MSEPTPKITAIPAFNDNYIWCIDPGAGRCAVVDPGDHRPVRAALEDAGLELDTILLTHHHADHTGGVAGLLERWPARVIGPADERIPHRSDTVGEGDRVFLDRLGLTFEVFEVPGHTRSHIAFHGHGALFSAGCGRLFEGTPAQMQVSLDKLARLPERTRVYCAHEYTQSNCRFALAAEPGNERLQKFAEDVRGKRARGEITLPSTLGLERAVNPFLRTREPAVVSSARARAPGTAPGAATLAVIREWKDGF